METVGGAYRLRRFLIRKAIVSVSAAGTPETHSWPKFAEGVSLLHPRGLLRLYSKSALTGDAEPRGGRTETHRVAFTSNLSDQGV